MTDQRMPITKILYGEDHPKFQTPVANPKESEYPGTQIARLLPARSREGLLRLKLQKGTRRLLEGVSG